MRAVVGISACYKTVEDLGFHCVAEKYINPLLDVAQCQPLLVPAVGARMDIETLLNNTDGLLLTGSASNVHPRHYGTVVEPHDYAHDDPQRDATTLPLIRSAIEHGVPLLALCRGHQELNVALGGTLHRHVERVEGMLDHREDESRPVVERYGAVHEVALTPGGVLAGVFGADRIHVNSLHSQGIDRLAERLNIEGTAPDGLVEAVTVRDAPSFAVGVQWHPEWDTASNPADKALFEAFGEACKKRAHQRARGSLRGT